MRGEPASILIFELDSSANRPGSQHVVREEAARNFIV